MRRASILLGMVVVTGGSAAAQQIRVDSLAAAYWQAELDRNPEAATVNGFPGPRNGRLTDLAPAAFDAYDARLRSLQRSAATIDSAGLTPLQIVTLRMLQESLTRDLSTRVCRAELWAVNQLDGPQVTLADLAALQPTATRDDRALLLARWRRIGAYLDQHVMNLRAGLAAGYTAPRQNVERVIGQLDQLLATPVDQSPLLPAAARPGAPGRDDRWAGQARAEVADVIIPS
ncbi:MAG: DUF885 family protein, partial [Gemmatimonadales bacterium]